MLPSPLIPEMLAEPVLRAGLCERFGDEAIRRLEADLERGGCTAVIEEDEGGEVLRWWFGDLETGR